MSAVISVVSSFIARLAKSPMLEVGDGYRERWFENCTSHGFESSVMGMVHTTQYGILMLYRHKCIQVMRCSK